MTEENMGALEVTKKPNGSEALAVAAPNPFTLFQQALSQGMTLEQMQVFEQMCERHEANEARKAFVSAMNAFKRNPPQILKNKHVEFGNTKYNHATLDHVCEQVTKGLSEHGISHRWKIAQGESGVTVTCVLTHEMGHSEETTLHGPEDKSGSKNAIQAVGSTVTYLQRYTLLAATGLAAASDTDGVPPEDESSTIPDERFVQLRDAIAGANTDDELRSAYQVAIQEAKQANDDTSARDFSKAKNQRYRELHNAGR